MISGWHCAGAQQSILRVFDGGVPGLCLDPSIMYHVRGGSVRPAMYQDLAGTATPVTSVEQPVGLIYDGRGNGFYAAATDVTKRPTFSKRVNLVSPSSYVTTTSTLGQAGGSAPPSISRVTYANELVEAITFPSGVTGWAVSRRANGSTWQQTAGVRYVMGARVALSRPLTTGEVITVFFTGSQGHTQMNITSTSQNPTELQWYYIASNAISTGGEYCAIISNGVSLNTPITVYLADQDARPENDRPARYQRVTSASSYDEAGFPAYLLFNGAQGLVTPELDLSSANKVLVAAGIRKLSDSARGMIVEFSSGSTNPGVFQMNAPQAATGSPFMFGSGGSLAATTGYATATATGSQYNAPVQAVMTGVGAIGATSVCRLRLNGSEAASSATYQGVGNYGRYPTYIGTRNDNSLQVRARMYGMFVRGGHASMTLISYMESYLNRFAKAY